jgi:hypothetical protein
MQQKRLARNKVAGDDVSNNNALGKRPRAVYYFPYIAQIFQSKSVEVIKLAKIGG